MKERVKQPRRSRENYRLLVDNAGEGILVAQDGSIKFANARCLAFTGYSEDELLSESFINLVHPEDRQTVIRYHAKRMQGDDSTFHYNFRIRTKAGNYEWMEIRSTLIPWDGRQAALCFLTDVTERKEAEEYLLQTRAELEREVEERTVELLKLNENLKAEINERTNTEEALRRSEQKYRELVESANSIILRMDRTGNVSFFNNFAQDFFGFKEEEIVGRNVVGTIVPELDSTGRDLAAMIEDIGRRPHLYDSNENENVLSNGERVWVSWTNRAIFNDEGVVEEILCIGNDITEHKKAKEALQRAHDELEAGVAERTSELTSRNKQLEREIERRKEAQAALKISEERYRLHFENANEVIFSYDRELKILNVSPASERLLGYPPKELIGKTVAELNIVHPDHLTRAFENAQRLLNGNRIGFQTYAFIARDGTTKYGETNSSPVWNESEVVAVVSVIRDVTRRVETEQALQQSESKQQAILETIEEGYFEVDLSGNFVFLNDAMARILDGAKEQLLGMNNRDYMDPDTAQDVYQAFNRVYTTGKPIKTSGWELITSPGEPRHIETSVSLISDASGIAQGFRGIVRDVTCRKRADDELRASEEKYRTIIENMEEGYFEVDLKGTMTLFNDSACRILGYPREELSGLNYRSFMDQANADKVFETFNQVYRTGETVRLSDWGIIRKDGARRIVDTPVALIRDNEGNPTGFRGLGRDITEKYYAAESLKKAHDDLERRVEERTAELKIINNELERQIAERREAEERYRTLVEVAPVAISIQREGKIVFANPETVRGFGAKSADELVGMTTRDLLESDLWEIVKQRANWMLQEWKSPPPIEFSGKRVDGTQGWAHIRSAPIMYGGKPSILVTAIDITERKKAEEQLRISIREKEVLLREIHHRVKNNLQLMASLLALQSFCSADAAEVGVLKEAESRIWSMAVAHETLYGSENLEKVNAAEYFSKLTEVLMGAFSTGTPHVELSTYIEDIQLKIDSAVNCGLILNELVTNCLKHAFPGRPEGNIIVTFKHHKQETLLLEVRDDGVGMPSDLDPDKIDTFGMDLVKTLVGDLKGTIRFTSDQGTVVQISFTENTAGRHGGRVR